MIQSCLNGQKTRTSRASSIVIDGEANRLSGAGDQWRSLRVTVSSVATWGDSREGGSSSPDIPLSKSSSGSSRAGICVENHHRACNAPRCYSNLPRSFQAGHRQQHSPKPDWMISVASLNPCNALRCCFGRSQRKCLVLSKPAN